MKDKKTPPLQKDFFSETQQAASPSDISTISGGISRYQMAHMIESISSKYDP